MPQFCDLPVEILPLFLFHLPKPHHLASACLVNTTFNLFGTPRLYEWITIYSWHKEAKVKVLQLFTVLGAYSYLAKHVRRLEIRDFPKAIIHSEIDITNLVVKGLRNCVNLRSCTWTRDGSLSSEILAALCSLQQLHEFEFNGHSQGQYDARILARFKTLSRISAIMPSSIVVSQLCQMMCVSGHILRHLTIICKASPIVTDDILESLSNYLINLEHLYLAGCSKVTGRGPGALVSASQPGLNSLGLESVSPKFVSLTLTTFFDDIEWLPQDMSAFARRCLESNGLTRLRSITLTISQSLPDTQAWMKAVIHLLSTSPLEKFQIYATPKTDRSQNKVSTLASASMESFWSDLISVHGKRLVRFSVHRMSIGVPAIHEVCSRCPQLEELFLVIEPRSLDALPASLSLAENLRTVHINYPLNIYPRDDSSDDESDDPRPVLSVAEALAFISRCGPSLSQFGSNTRVWQVARAFAMDKDGLVRSELKLLPYESQDIPEQFLVVRS